MYYDMNSYKSRTTQFFKPIFDVLYTVRNGRHKFRPNSSKALGTHNPDKDGADPSQSYGVLSRSAEGMIVEARLILKLRDVTPSQFDNTGFNSVLLALWDSGGKAVVALYRKP